MVRGSVESLQLASIFSTYPAAALNVWQAALVEVVITSILMGMIMALTDDGNGIPKGSLAPLLIGILVAVIGASTGPLTGFAMNPARDFYLQTVHMVSGVGEHGDERWARDPFILSCRLSRLLSAPVPEQPYIAILLVRIYLVTAVNCKKMRTRFTAMMYRKNR